MTSKVAIGMGSNLGNCFSNMAATVEDLKRLGGQAFRCSSLFKSKAVDCKEPYDFLNAAVCFETAIPAETLLTHLMDIEHRFGRERPYPNAPRRMDLDLLLYGETVLQSSQLTLPHPRMHQRLFVLSPLAEIWPDAVHPILKSTVSQLRQTALVAEEESAVAKHPFQWSHVSF